MSFIGSHDATCSDPNQDGYVGVTARLSRRLGAHKRRDRKRSANFPADFDCRVLLSGALADCLALEEQLRPVPGIGWNFERGGRQPYLGYEPSEAERKRISERNKGRRKGYKHSAESIKKMSDAVKARYEDPTKREATAVHLRAILAARSAEVAARFRDFQGNAVCINGHQRIAGKPCLECRRTAVRRFRERHKR